MDYQITRLNSSTYQSKESLEKEASLINALEHCQWKDLDQMSNSDQSILICNTHTDFSQIDPTLLLNTKLMIHSNSGYDNLDCFFKNYDAPFPIIKGNSIRAAAVTEYIVSCLFQHVGRVRSFNKWDSDRSFSRDLLSEKNILIYGYGHIGKLLKDRLQYSCSKLHFIDPKYSLNSDLPLSSFDYIIFACALNDGNRSLVDKDYLSSLKKNVCLINPARGPLIKKNHLISYLGDRDEAFAYLDVFEIEPENFDDYSVLNNISLTSHIAGVYSGLSDGIISFELKVISDFLKLNRKDFNHQYNEQLYTYERL